MKYLITLLLLTSCGREREEPVQLRPKVTVEKAEPTTVVVEAKTGEKGEVGEKGDNGRRGTNGVNGTNGTNCYTQNDLARTRWHHDHDDYYYDVLMVCPGNTNFVGRDVRYHEEL